MMDGRKDFFLAAAYKILLHTAHRELLVKLSKPAIN
jgi:hypothetical protein